MAQIENVPGLDPVRFSSSCTRARSSGIGAISTAGSDCPAPPQARVADIHPRLVDIDAPVDAHHVAAGCVQFAEKSDAAPVPK